MRTNMYSNRQYGLNWQPTSNHARRFNPYERSCTILVSLFALGLLLIIIIVLSLIPVYLSSQNQNDSTRYVSVIRISIENYTLASENSTDLHQMFSQTNNRQALQAALTSMIQNDDILVGSVVEIINGSSSNSTLNLLLSIITNQTCNTPICLDDYDVRLTNILGQNNQTTPAIRYEYFNGTTTFILWIEYQLPDEIQSSVSIVSVDSESIKTSLNNLLNYHQVFNRN